MNDRQLPDCLCICVWQSVLCSLAHYDWIKDDTSGTSITYGSQLQDACFTGERCRLDHCHRQLDTDRNGGFTT